MDKAIQPAKLQCLSNIHFKNKKENPHRTDQIHQSSRVVSLSRGESRSRRLPRWEASVASICRVPGRACLPLAAAMWRSVSSAFCG